MPVPAAARIGTSSVRLAVAVVMPLFDGRRYLREAVESVLSQTAVPGELIVVDDGSSDGAVAQLDGIRAPFPVRVLHQARLGQSAARNLGVSATDAELVAFLDQDDVWHPEHLAELCAPFHDDSEVGWVYSDFDEVDEEGRLVTRSFIEERGLVHPRRSLTECLVEDLMVIPSASVMRRSMFEAIGGFDPVLQGYEDDDLYVRTFRAGWHLVFLPRSLARFRVHAASSSTEPRFIESRRLFSQKLLETVPDDRRLNRTYSRDVIAPRFLRAALNDYVSAVSGKDWRAARRIRPELWHFASIHRHRTAIRCKLALVWNPRICRVVLRVIGSLPFGRGRRDPVYRLR